METSIGCLTFNEKYFGKLLVYAINLQKSTLKTTAPADDIHPVPG